MSDKCPKCGVGKSEENPVLELTGHIDYDYVCGFGWEMNSGVCGAFIDGVDCLRMQLARALEREKRLRRIVNMVRIVDKPEATAPSPRLVALFIGETIHLLVGKGMHSLLGDAAVNEIAEALDRIEEVGE